MVQGLKHIPLSVQTGMLADLEKEKVVCRLVFAHFCLRGNLARNKPLTIPRENYVTAELAGYLYIIRP
jgi:hypothetical protein